MPEIETIQRIVDVHSLNSEELDIAVHTRVFGHKLIPREEALAIARDVWKSQPACEVFLRGFRAHAENGEAIFDGWTIPSYQADHAANNEVLRWLLQKGRMNTVEYGSLQCRVGSRPIDCDHWMLSEFALYSEADSDQTLAYRIAICRLAVKIAQQ
jgi:hypothetical protein